MAFNYMENISYNNNRPNFERDSVKTVAQLLAVNPAEKGYDYGHIVFCEEDGKHYKYNYNYNNPPSDGEKDAVTGWFVPLNADTADGSITTEKLATYAVTNEKIANDAIANRHIAPKSIGKEEIMDGHIITSKIEDGAVTAEKLAPAVSEKIETVEAAVVEEKARAEAAEKAITDLISNDAEIVEALTNVAAWIKDATTEGEAAKLIADVEALKPLKPVVNAHEAIIGIKTVTAIVKGINPSRLDFNTVPPAVVEQWSGYFEGYKVDLTAYRGRYNAVYFRGANYTKSGNLIRGYILDDEGVVESYIANVDSNSNGWQELPLTEKSATLRASYCTDETGGEKWTPEAAILFNGSGMLNEIDTLRSVEGEVEALTDEVSALEATLVGSGEARQRVTIASYGLNPAKIADTSATPLTLVEASSGYFLGYKIDLTPYRGKYDKIYFRGSNFSTGTKNVIARGVILLDDGVTIESYVPTVKSNSNGWQELPLTEKSGTLRASYCFSSGGGDVWYPYAKTGVTDITDYVEFVREPVSGLSERVEALGTSVKSVEGIIEGADESLDVTAIVKGLKPARLDFNTVPPAVVEESSGYFEGYKVDLTAYRGRYNAVYFRGANYTKSSNLIRGYILDDEGVVESYIANVDSNSNGWQELPLTEKSATLRASYCIDKSGGEKWTPEKVTMRFFRLGVSARMDGIEETAVSLTASLDELSEKVDYIEETGGLQKIEVHLPEDLYVLGDRTTQLFYRGFIRAVNPYIYDIKVMCKVGKTFPRYYEITKNTAAGDYPLRLQVRDDNKNILADKEITLHVVGLPATMSPRNVLCCGASATQTGRWPGELKRMLADAGVPMNFVGRKYVDAEDVNLEATGGWTWTTFISSGQAAIRFYITSMAGEVGSGTKLLLDGKTYTVLEVNLTEGVGNIRCQPPTDDTQPAVESGTLTTSDGSTTLEFSSWASERFVPFYNTETGQIDFKTYADKYCDGHIDLLIIHIGVNSTLWETNNVSGVIASAEKFIDGYLADFPDGKLIFSTIPMPDDGSNVYANSYGVSNINRYGTLTTFMLYNTSMYELTQRDEYKGKVLFAPSSIFFDTDYGYPKTKKNVNTRISEYTELIGTNGMHPVVEGSYMIADGILPIFTLLD